MNDTPYHSQGEDTPTDPRCEQVWRQFANAVTDTPEQRYRLDMRLKAFLETIEAPILRAHYQMFFRQRRAERYRTYPPSTFETED